MKSSVRPWVAWVLPFLLSAGLACGAVVGMTVASDAARQEGPAGDLAGAAGALMVVICVLVGFVMAALTTIVGSVVRRGLPKRVLLRIGLSIVAGGTIGVLGSGSGVVRTVAAWVLLLGVPIALSWPWRRRGVSTGAGVSVE